ncbi:MAG: ABC-2 transporter permease [Lachnospiraceae bacterium]|nr:ABC-2 transporter permease [Lachnospiraceae bacterium]
MKGLLKNNFFTVCTSAKTFSIFMLMLGIFVVSVISQPLLIGYVLLGMVGFSINAATSIKKEFASKWGKYKLTLPVKRTDIVKSYFISQLLWLFIGALFAGLIISLSWRLHGCPFDNSIDTISLFALGISISLFTGSFFFPLFYLGGEDRSDAFLIISLLCGVGIALVIVSTINYYLDPGRTTILLGAAVLIICSLLMFALSYLLTVNIFNRKEY